MGVSLVLGLIGLYDFELKCLDYAVRLIKVNVIYINVPYYDMKCQCVNLTYMNCNERTYTHAIVIELLLMMIIQELDHMT